MALAKPEATYTEDLHRFAWPDGFEMILERFNESKDDIACELTVHSAHPTRGGTLVDGKRLLLIGPNSQRDMKRTLEGRDAEPDWGGMLEQATTLSRRRYREGEPPTDLRDEMSATSRYLVRPVLLDGGTTVWFGSEESAKSLTAMEVAVVVATGCEISGFVSERTGPVLYLDWEDDANTHKERLRAICAGVGIDIKQAEIHHVRMSASLSESSRDLRKLVAKLGVILIVVDSIGMASGGDPQDAGGIIRAMTAARSLGAPVLGIHHLPKESRDKSRPYGSVYAAAEARMTWLVEKDEDAPAGCLRIAMTNKKSNRSARHPRLAFEFRFQTTADREELSSVTMAPVGFMEAVGIGSSGSQKWRIAALLVVPMTLEAIAEVSGITKATVRMQLNRHKDLFVRAGDLWSRISDSYQSESGESVIQGVNQGAYQVVNQGESVENQVREYQHGEVGASKGAAPAYRPVSRGEEGPDREEEQSRLDSLADG